MPGGEQWLQVDAAIGDIDGDAIKRQMIKRTIEEHLKKELRLGPQGIKVLPDQQEASAYRGAGSRGEPPDREHVISTQEVCHGAEQGSVPEGAVDARVLRAVRVGATV
jgi:type III restriction enzyme